VHTKVLSKEQFVFDIGPDESKGETMGHLLAASYSYSSSSSGTGFIFELIFYVVTALGTYGAYKKAGQPGWAAFVPIYNFYILCKVAGRPGWWTWSLLLLIIPFLGWIAFLVIAIIVLNDVSKSFGHGGGFTVGLVLLSTIFWYILWLGSSTYRGPAAAGGAMGNPNQYPPQGPQGGYPPPSPPPPGFPSPPPGQMPPPPGQMPPPPGQMPPPQ
jgi:hypothetical protein